MIRPPVGLGGWVVLAVLFALPVRTAPAQDLGLVPPAGAAVVPAPGLARVEIVLSRGDLRIREYGASEIRYVPVGSEEVIVTRSSGAHRLLAGARLEGLDVWVPRGTAIRVEVNSGGADIRLAGVTGPLEVANSRGSIAIDGSPSALAVNTSRGSVRWRQRSWQSAVGPFAIAIHVGSLYLDLPPDAGVDVDMRRLFNGTLETPMGKRKYKTPSGERVRIGRGGPTVHVSIEQGSLHVLP